MYSWDPCTCSLGLFCISLKVNHMADVSLTAMLGGTAADHERMHGECREVILIVYAYWA